MPSFTRATSNCCTSRGPPSPDGPAPRQVPVSSSPDGSRRRLFKDHFPLWATVHASDLKAIHEDDQLQSLPDNGSRIRHRSSARLEAIRESKDYNSISEVDPAQCKIKKTSSTIKAVKQTLKKGLSRDSSQSKRQHSKSSSSVGTSEEGIERRAELRRPRPKRIQEELSNEGIYDDDAKSLASFGNILTPPKSPEPAVTKPLSVWIPGDFDSSPVLANPTLPCPTFRFPEYSPLDESTSSPTEATPLSLGTPRRGSYPAAAVYSASKPDMIEERGNLYRRYSSPVLATRDVLPVEPKMYILSSKRASMVPPMPPAPTLQPRRLSSIDEPCRRSSWRLSYTADNRSEHLRKLSRDHQSPVSVTPEQLALNKMSRWLHSQGLRSGSHAVSRTDSPSASSALSPSEYKSLDEFPSPPQTHTAADNFGGVDGVAKDGAEKKTDVHLQDMRISSRLASTVFSSHVSSPDMLAMASPNMSALASPDMSKLELHKCGSCPSSDSQSENSARVRHAQKNTSDSDPSDGSIKLSDLHIPGSWGRVVVNGATSSFYPSFDNSLQPSPDSSRANVYDVLPGTRYDFKFADSKGSELAPELSRSLLQTDTANVSTTSLTVPLARYQRRYTADDNSLPVSETESYHQREVELSAIKTRFASSECRRATSTPVSSRFREDFALEPVPSPRSVGSRRGSVRGPLARLARAITTFDGPGSVTEDLLDVPIPKFNPEALRSPGFGKTPGSAGLLHPNPFAADDSANVWETALKHRAAERTEHVASRLQLPNHIVTRNSKQKSHITDEAPKGVFGKLNIIKPGRKKEAQKSAAEEYNERFEQRLAIKELVMDSWEEEMAASAAKAKAKSKYIIKKAKPMGPDHRFPASWSRFPSHNRLDRASAAKDDRVEVKDFAKLGREDDGEIIWCLEHDDDGHHEVVEDSEHGKGFRDKLGDRLREKKYHFQTLEQSVHTGGRRGSLTVAGDVEYPELEILPPGKFSAQVMEDVIPKTKQVSNNEEEKQKTRDIARGAGSTPPANISINDAKFYDEGLLGVGRNDGAGNMERKYRTWGGRYARNWGARALEEQRPKRTSLSSMVLMSRSEDEYYLEVSSLAIFERGQGVLEADDCGWVSGLRRIRSVIVGR